MAAGPDGSLWVGTQQGLVRTSDGGKIWSVIDTLPNPTPTRIENIAIGAHGVVWVSTSEDLAFGQDDGSSWLLVPIEGDLPEWLEYMHLTAGADGTAYIGRAWNWMELRFFEGVCQFGATLECFHGQVLGAYSLDEEQWDWTDTKGVEGNERTPRCLEIHDLTITADGTLWLSDFGSLTAMVRGDNSVRWYQPGIQAYSVGLARDGGVWAGINANGDVAHYQRKGNAFLVGPTIGGLPKCAWIESIVEAPDGTLWVAAEWFDTEDGSVVFDAGLYKTSAAVEVLAGCTLVGEARTWIDDNKNGEWDDGENPLDSVQLWLDTPYHEKIAIAYSGWNGVARFEYEYPILDYCGQVDEDIVLFPETPSGLKLTTQARMSVAGELPLLFGFASLE